MVGFAFSTLLISASLMVSPLTDSPSTLGVPNTYILLDTLLRSGAPWDLVEADTNQAAADFSCCSCRQSIAFLLFGAASPPSFIGFSGGWRRRGPLDKAAPGFFYRLKFLHDILASLDLLQARLADGRGASDCELRLDLLGLPSGYPWLF
eukprot:TRINITY_DN9785_c0_g1_i1.p1 TRINITY_DN9785_c0_g1~~TRINITY_DN9785_c0_g1_i1.p1  ORF type:complete len:150 (+),score=20.40 TRINITY_DN9785_c0_g1_i1:264-713(+)